MAARIWDAITAGSDIIPSELTLASKSLIGQLLRFLRRISIFLISCYCFLPDADMKS